MQNGTAKLLIWFAGAGFFAMVSNSLFAGELNQKVFVQEKYVWSSGESTAAFSASFKDVCATVAKIKTRLEKYSYRKTVLMQLLQLENVLDSLRKDLEGEILDYVQGGQVESRDELRKNLVKQLYIEAKLLHEMNKNLGYSKRAKKSRFKKLLTQIHTFADAGQLIILD